MSDGYMSVEDYLNSGGVIAQCEAKSAPTKRKPRAKRYTRTVTQNRYEQTIKQLKRKQQR